MFTDRQQLQMDKLIELLKSRAGSPAALWQLAESLGLSITTVRHLMEILFAAGRVKVGAERGRERSFALAEDGTATAPPAGGGSAPPPPSPPGPAGPGALPPAPAPRKGDERFDARQLDRMVISLPLQQFLQEWEAASPAGAAPDSARLERIGEHTRMFDGDRFSVIINLHADHLGGMARARQRVLDLLLMVEIESGSAAPGDSPLQRVAPVALRETGGQYVIARLRAAQIRRLVELDQLRTLPSATVHRRAGPAGHAHHAKPAIFRIWPDNVVRRQAYTSMPTIKADAARNSFGCSGRGIVWAVVDSGIDGNHRHFTAFRNLQDLPAGVEHSDFVDPAKPAPLVDVFGHGTHVAGIIAGALSAGDDARPLAVVYERDASAHRQEIDVPLAEVSGVAPQCKLVSYKVLDDKGRGGVSEIMAAVEDIQRANGYGKAIRIHGVNMSLGYPYDPQWFACGQSPLCEVVDRLARSGVCVVVAAGNSGYGYMDTLLAGTWAQGMTMSINDPGNAELAITVGSTHREAPHTYGVSYFSSKGPTGDGRNKPDLLAPGEKIVSCLSGSTAAAAAEAADRSRYREDSGTSMATPHVSGAIAALLSVRREFIGRSDEVKRILLDSALDLGRDRSMQGRGLLDLFRALQSI